MIVIERPLYSIYTDLAIWLELVDIVAAQWAGS